MLNNKLTNYCHRIINKFPDLIPRHNNYYLVASILESICDDYKNMIYSITHSGNDDIICKEILVLLDESNSLLRSIYDLFYKYSKESIQEVRKKQKDFDKKIINFTKEKNIAKNNLCIIIGVYINKISQHYYDILGSISCINH